MCSATYPCCWYKSLHEKLPAKEWNHTQFARGRERASNRWWPSSIHRRRRWWYEEIMMMTCPFLYVVDGSRTICSKVLHCWVSASCWLAVNSTSTTLSQGHKTSQKDESRYFYHGRNLVRDKGHFFTPGARSMFCRPPPTFWFLFNFF